MALTHICLSARAGSGGQRLCRLTTLLSSVESFEVAQNLCVTSHGVLQNFAGRHRLIACLLTSRYRQISLAVPCTCNDWTTAHSRCVNQVLLQLCELSLSRSPDEKKCRVIQHLKRFRSLVAGCMLRTNSEWPLYTLYTVLPLATRN